ncbi:hypothetical protein AB5J72_27250 [Streptomyces sp. CG1]|uniref:hypothetical protein n=1 Tax=Streptomyces sp. CG1 TaxID=1287523 RepID=UPI0034E2FEAD
MTGGGHYPRARPGRDRPTERGAELTATTEHNAGQPETGSDTETAEPTTPDDQGDDEHQDDATASLGAYLLLIG